MDQQLERLSDASPRERALAIRQLLSFHRDDDRVTAAVLGVAKDSDWRVRAGLITELSTVTPDREFVPALARLLADKNPIVSMSAAQTLCKWTTSLETALAVLVGALDKMSESELCEVLSSLEGMDFRAPKLLPKILDLTEHPSKASARVAVCVLGAWRVGGAEVHGRLRSLLGQKAAELYKSDTLWALALTGGIQANDRVLLSRVLTESKRDDFELQSAVAFGNWQLGGSGGDSLPVLQRAVAAGRGELYCITAMADMGSKGVDVAPILREYSHHEQTTLRACAAAALARVNKSGFDVETALLGFVGDSEAEVRRHVAEGLGWMSKASSEAIRALGELLRKHPLSQEAPLAAIARIGEAASPLAADVIFILEFFPVDYPGIVAALGAIGPSAREALPLLQDLIGSIPVDAELRGAVQKAIVSIERR